MVDMPRLPIHHGSRQLVIQSETALNRPKSINNREIISCVQENNPNYPVFPHPLREELPEDHFKGAQVYLLVDDGQLT